MNYIILNGIDSRTITGLLIQSLPPIIKPAIRTETTEIDGRDGDITTDLGYSAYDRTISIGLHGNYNIDKVIKFFNSQGTAVFSNEDDKLYNYAIYQQINFEKLIRFKTAEIVFHCQPFKASLIDTAKELTPVIATAEGSPIVLTPTTAGETLKSIVIGGYSNRDYHGNITTTTGSLSFTFMSSDNMQSVVKPVNLGTNELCKIGTYQDILHKQNGEWKKRVSIKKMTVNADNIGIVEFSNINYATIPKPTDALCYGNSLNYPLLCTKATYIDKPTGTWNTPDMIGKITTGNNSFLSIGFPPYKTIEDMKTALSGCEIYYVLLERKDVAISEALSNELEALLNVKLYDGSTGIVVFLPYASISATAVNQTFTVENIGNIYSRPKLTIYGSGLIYVDVNGERIFTINLPTDDYITIDGAEMDAYKDTIDNLKNRLVNGNYENFRFKVGENKIKFSGDITKAILENYSRYI